MVTVLPEIDTALLSSTLIVVTVELSLDFLIVMFPDPTDTFSEKVSTRLAVSETPVAPSAGEYVETVGAVLSLFCENNNEKYNKLRNTRYIYPPKNIYKSVGTTGTI